MALRDQPYLPLYVQDFLTDEKLRECSAESVGVYIMTICVLHKSTEYGTILLMQKDKQNKELIRCFATKLSRHLPFDTQTIERSLQELIDNSVLILDGDKLLQLRMVQDNNLSLKRAESGKKRWNKGNFANAKPQASAENESENETLGSDNYLISICNEKFNKKLSEILNNEYSDVLDIALSNTGKAHLRDLVLKEADIQYGTYDFKDRNHLTKAVNKLVDSFGTKNNKKMVW